MPRFPDLFLRDSHFGNAVCAVCRRKGLKTTPKIGKVAAINLDDDTTEMMLISQFGKIIRIDTKSIRAAGRSTSGVKLLNLYPDDRIAAAVAIPPKTPNPTAT